MAADMISLPINNSGNKSPISVNSKENEKWAQTANMVADHLELKEKFEGIKERDLRINFKVDKFMKTL